MRGHSMITIKIPIIFLILEISLRLLGRVGTKEFINHLSQIIQFAFISLLLKEDSDKRKNKWRWDEGRSIKD